MRGWNAAGASSQGFLVPDFTSPLARYRFRACREPDHDGHRDDRRRALISIPIGIGAARNLAPLPVYLVCRSIIAISRSLQEIIVAILFVAMFGFGPFAGFLTLTFATIGFMAKLLAEDIEDIDESQAEAVRATGASWWQVVNYAVQPQVMPRLIGLSLYRLDINFRESAVIGIVGAGGIGATLNTAIDRYEYDSAGRHPDHHHRHRHAGRILVGLRPQVGAVMPVRQACNAGLAQAQPPPRNGRCGSAGSRSPSLFVYSAGR